MSAVAPPLPPDLVAGLRRLKLASVRRIAPEICQTAKTQRWAPEELLRTLIEAELAARDRSNRLTRLKQAAFPVSKTLDEFKVQLSSVPHHPGRRGWALSCDMKNSPACATKIPHPA